MNIVTNLLKIIRSNSVALYGIITYELHTFKPLQVKQTRYKHKTNILRNCNLESFVLRLNMFKKGSTGNHVNSNSSHASHNHTNVCITFMPLVHYSQKMAGGIQFFCLHIHSQPEGICHTLPEHSSG